METLDPVAGQFECLDRGGIASLHGPLDLIRANAQTLRIEFKPIEPACRLDQRDVPAIAHVVDDQPGGGLDVGRDLALHCEKFAEFTRKIGTVSV